jgi:hypothetical protein
MDRQRRVEKENKIKTLGTERCVNIKTLHINKNIIIIITSHLSKKLKIKIYKTIILPVVLYGCETWSLTLREESNEELHSLYRSPNIVRVTKYRRFRWAGHVARMEEGKRAFKILTGKPTGKRPLGRPRLRWKDNIRMDPEEIGINAGNWVGSAQDTDYWRTLVNAALNLLVP